MAAHTTEQFDTVVLGGGQAGLATGYHLKRQGASFVILDGSDQVGDSWRGRWPSLRLYTPARYDALPGMAFPARGSSFQARTRWRTTSRRMRPGSSCRFAAVSTSMGSPRARIATWLRRARGDSRPITSSSRPGSCRTRSSPTSPRSSIRRSPSSTRVTTEARLSCRRAPSSWSAPRIQAATSLSRSPASTTRCSGSRSG